MESLSVSIGTLHYTGISLHVHSYMREVRNFHRLLDPRRFRGRLFALGWAQIRITSRAMILGIYHQVSVPAESKGRANYRRNYPVGRMGDKRKRREKIEGSENYVSSDVRDSNGISRVFLDLPSFFSVFFLRNCDRSSRQEIAAI